MRLLILALLLMSISACEEPFEASFSPANQCWTISDTLTMVDYMDNAGQCAPQISVVFLQEYAYTNLQMKLLYQGPDDICGEYDFQSSLITPTGDWLLESNGGRYPLLLQIKDPLELPQPGRYTFSLIHNMREDVICNIASIGMRIPKTE